MEYSKADILFITTAVCVVCCLLHWFRTHDVYDTVTWAAPQIIGAIVVALRWLKPMKGRSRARVDDVPPFWGAAGKLVLVGALVPMVGGQLIPATVLPKSVVDGLVAVGVAALMIPAWNFSIYFTLHFQAFFDESTSDRSKKD